MKTLDEIKQMMATGETVQADEALKELLEKEPTNLQAKMLYGTCRQLLGDEETFRRIHDELTPVMVKLSDISLDTSTSIPTETLSLWKKYQTLWEYLIIAGLVMTGVVAGVLYLGKNILGQFASAYAGPGYQDIRRQQQDTQLLYGGPRYDRLYGGPRYDRPVFTDEREKEKFSDNNNL